MNSDRSQLAAERAEFDVKCRLRIEEQQNSLTRNVQVDVDPTQTFTDRLKSQCFHETDLLLTPKTCLQVTITSRRRTVISLWSREMHIMCAFSACAFSALTLLVGHQEEYPACKTLS